MYLGNTFTVPNRVTLPGQTGGESGGELESIANNFSMQFNGIDEYFDPGTDSSLDIFGSDFSASLWFNTTGTNTSAGLIQIASFTNKFAITKGSNAGNLGFVIGTNSWRYNIGS